MKTGMKLGMLALGALLLMAPARRNEAFGDPIGNYNFSVQIDGVDAGQFAGVTGLAMWNDVIEYQNGDDPITRKRPGRFHIGDVTLQKGYMGSTVLNDWIEQSRLGNGDYTRKHVSIVLHNNGNPMNGNSEIKRWNLFECFPAKWSMSEMNGNASQVLTESMVVTCEWFEEA